MAHQEAFPEPMQHRSKFFALVVKLSPANLCYLQRFLPMLFLHVFPEGIVRLLLQKGEHGQAVKQDIMDLRCPAEHWFSNFCPWLQASKYRISQSEMTRIKWQDFLGLYWPVIPVNGSTVPVTASTPGQVATWGRSPFRSHTVFWGRSVCNHP